MDISSFLRSALLFSRFCPIFALFDLLLSSRFPFFLVSFSLPSFSCIGDIFSMRLRPALSLFLAIFFAFVVVPPRLLPPLPFLRPFPLLPFFLDNSFYCSSSFGRFHVSICCSEIHFRILVEFRRLPDVCLICVLGEVRLWFPPVLLSSSSSIFCFFGSLYVRMPLIFEISRRSPTPTISPRIVFATKVGILLWIAFGPSLHCFPREGCHLDFTSFRFAG